MTDSIHPENDDILQPESENINKSDINDASDLIENDTLSEENLSQEIQEDAYQNDDASYEYEEEVLPEENIDSEEISTEDDTLAIEPKENKGAAFSALKLFLANKIYAFSKLDKKKKVRLITTYSVIFILTFLILTDLIPILPNSYHRSYVGNQFTIGQTSHSKSVSYRKGVIYAKSGSVMCFGPDMELLSRIDTFDGKPYVRTNGDGAIVYAKNGNKALVMTSEKDYNIVESAEMIISASVNNDGGYVLVSKEAGYTACVSAYNADRKCIYKWHTGNNILDTAISPDSKNIVASVIEYSDTSLYSKLVFLNTSKKEPVMQIELDSCLATELVFLNSNTVVAIGDTFTTAYTPDGNEKWHIDYDGRLLSTYDISDDGTIAFLFNRYNSALSESFVEIYNARGKRVGKYNSPDNIRTISLNNNYCLLTFDDSTVLIDKDGDDKKTKPLKNEYSNLILFENYNFAFSTLNGVAEILSVRH